VVMYCLHCGAENPESAKYCNLCFTTMGFESLEYTSVAGSDEGYLDSYPSSFHEGAVDGSGRQRMYPGTDSAARAKLGRRKSA